MPPSHTPTVSVIVPNYNHARFLRKRIDSILQQTFHDFELILLDDCSTDDSRSILSSYAGDSRVRIEFNDANSGSTFKQWNKGVRLARGKYVWIAESDDYADPRLLERLVAVLDADREVSFVYCRSWRVSADDRMDGFVDRYLTDMDPVRWTMDYCADGRQECQKYFVLRNIVANASAVLFRKAKYETANGADESMRMCGDWKLWASMALIGKVSYVSTPLNYFRIHDQNIWGKDSLRPTGAQETLRVIGWILQRVTPPETVKETLYELTSNMWVPFVMSAHVPLGVKRAILKEARAINPHAMRRAVRPGLATIRRKFARHFQFARHI